MKRNSLSIALTVMLGIGSFSAYAGGEAVNCRTETVGQQPIYAGWASCRVNNETIGQYFHPTSMRTALITQWTGNGYAQCWANIPYYGSENIVRQVCDYKPTADITVFSHELEGTIIRAGGSDSDGTIVKKQLWVNDILQSGSTVINYDRPGTYLKIKVTVTDDDGYTDTKVQSYNVQPPQCDQGPVNEC